MADSLSISPVALFSPAGVPPVAFALPANGRPAPAISSVANRDSVVDLSANGQLLSALFTFRSALEAQPVDTVDSSPANLANTAQSLIEQAGTLEAAVVNTVAPPSIALPLATPEPATVATTGVPPLPGTAPDDGGSIGTTINPLAQPPAATPLPPVAAAPPAIDPPPALVPDDAVSGEVLTLPLPPTDVPEVVIANTVPADQPNPPATTAGTPPTVQPPAIAAPTPTPTPATAVPTVTPPPLAADAIAAERRASDNAIALQTLLSDPRLRALDNHADPAYAAVIAATHLSDFDSPRPFTDARALATDTIGPISALARARAIADYREIAGEAEQRTLIGTSTTRQYWV